MTSKHNKIKIGARWDDASQNIRFQTGKARGLIDFIEVNYPISAGEDPSALGLPIYAHTSNNPVSNPNGINLRVAESVKRGAEISDCPWIGEHLAWLGFCESGALGYVLNPLFTSDFKTISVENTKKLKDFYNRPVALELGPVYTRAGEFESEMHFLGTVAEEADCQIILDVTHWTISNRNLRRDKLYGLEALPKERVVEMHAAGMRKSRSQDFWHDAHGLPLEKTVLDLFEHLIPRFPNLQAITFEHSMEGSEEDFYTGLESLRKKVA